MHVESHRSQGLRSARTHEASPTGVTVPACYHQALPIQPKARHMYWIAAFLLFFLAAMPASAAKDELVIGISQFPSNFNPNIDNMLAKAYVLGMARRPITDRKSTRLNSSH